MSFEKEKEYIWKKFAEVERKIDELGENITDRIVHTASESQKEADFARRKVTEYKNKSQKNKEESDQILQEIILLSDRMELASKQILEYSNHCKEVSDSVADSEKNIVNTLKEAESKFESISEVYEVLSELPEKYEGLEGELEALEQNVSSANDNTTKIRNQLNQVIGIRKEFNEVYDEYFGYETEEGEVEKGKIERLDLAIEELKDDLARIKAGIKTFQEQSENVFNKKYEELNAKIDDFVESKIAAVNEVESQLKSLMPDALTKGLSYAYQEKKTSEEINYCKLEISFKWNIVFIAAISFIPVLINVFLLINGAKIQEVLADTPKLIFSVMPLYLPVVWLAFSNNKKMNLSKRLIEEYTHKEVLSKTYEGLSNQVNSLGNSKASIDLRDKLLFNLIEINSENPGKLISNYDKSDHPFMEALDRSVQLSDSIERLAKIPGFRKMAVKLSEKSEILLKQQEQKVEQGIDMVSERERDELHENDAIAQKMN